MGVMLGVILGKLESPFIVVNHNQSRKNKQFGLLLVKGYAHIAR